MNRAFNRQTFFCGQRMSTRHGCGSCKHSGTLTCCAPYALTLYPIRGSDVGPGCYKSAPYNCQDGLLLPEFSHCHHVHLRLKGKFTLRQTLDQSREHDQLHQKLNDVGQQILVFAFFLLEAGSDLERNSVPYGFTMRWNGSVLSVKNVEVGLAAKLESVVLQILVKSPTASILLFTIF